MASMPTSQLVRVFVGASVLFVAALSARGYARDLLLAGFRGRLMLWVSDVVMEETERNLAAKAPAALPYFLMLKPPLTQNIVSPALPRSSAWPW